MSKGRARGFRLPLSVIQKAYGMGVRLEQLQEMVVLSARCTHKLGNRRYHDYVFQVQGEKVLDLAKLGDEDTEDEVLFDCLNCKDERKVVVFDPCDNCDGAGCRLCDDGLIQNFIDCPLCIKTKTI